MGPSAGLEGCGKSRPQRDSIPNRRASSESLYPLSYPGPYGQRRTLSNLDTSPLFTATCGGTSKVAVNGNRVQ